MTVYPYKVFPSIVTSVQLLSIRRCLLSVVHLELLKTQNDLCLKPVCPFTVNKALKTFNCFSLSSKSSKPPHTVCMYLLSNIRFLEVLGVLNHLSSSNKRQPQPLRIHVPYIMLTSSDQWPLTPQPLNLSPLLSPLPPTYVHPCEVCWTSLYPVVVESI